MPAIQRKMTLVDGAPSSPRDKTARNSIRPNTTGIGRARRNNKGGWTGKRKDQSSLGWLEQRAIDSGLVLGTVVGSLSEKEKNHSGGAVGTKGAGA